MHTQSVCHSPSRLFLSVTHTTPTPAHTGALRSVPCLRPMPPTQPGAAFGVLHRASPVLPWISSSLFTPWQYLFCPSPLRGDVCVGVRWVFPSSFDNSCICVNICLAFILSKSHAEGFEQTLPFTNGWRWSLLELRGQMKKLRHKGMLEGVQSSSIWILELIFSPL